MGRRVSRRDARRHRGAARGVADSGAPVAGALRHSAGAGLRAQLDRLQGRALLRRLRAGDPGTAVGRVAVAIPGRASPPTPNLETTRQIPGLPHTPPPGHPPPPQTPSPTPPN